MLISSGVFLTRKLVMEVCLMKVSRALSFANLSATIHQRIQGPKVIKSYDKSKDQRPKSCSEGPAKEKALADPAAEAKEQ